MQHLPYVSVSGRNGSSEIRALPDSGVEVTAADVKILPLFGKNVDNLLEPTHLKTSSVDGSPLQANGQLPVAITLGETEVKDMIQIFPSIPGGLLLSWSTSKNLCILQPDYPKQLCKIKAGCYVGNSKMPQVFGRFASHFDVITDHDSLLSILNSKRLDEIENPRLQRLKIKLVSHNFTAQRVKSSLNAGPDALSRYLTSEAKTTDQLAEEATPSIFAITAQAQQRALNMRLTEVLEVADDDPVYQELKTVIMNGFPKSKNQPFKCLTEYWCVHDDLSFDNDLIMYGCRLLISHTMRNEMSRRLHESHQGITRTRERARLAIYWPGIDHDIEKVITPCKTCQDELPSVGKKSMLLRTPASRPFQELAVDFA